MSNGMQRRDFIPSTGLVAEAAAAASLMEAPALAQTSPNAGLKPITYDIRPMSFDPNASAITALIEEAGFVRREPSEQDGRAIRLFATAAGLAKATGARPILARFNARMTQGFGEREIATIARFLNTILDRF
jgi:hypothetical protein